MTPLSPRPFFVARHRSSLRCSPLCREAPQRQHLLAVLVEVGSVHPGRALLTSSRVTMRPIDD